MVMYHDLAIWSEPLRITIGIVQGGRHRGLLEDSQDELKRSVDLGTLGRKLRYGGHCRRFENAKPALLSRATAYRNVSREATTA